ncbi:hypothetical protein [Cellulosilyticum ruminicola]|uniref:hypothetical protein n=1 Tax=Cellulosilyticum ruminicola TaxID=425254 RepID=UPI0006D0CEAF|nr:hypothetical protein [Cellulosilyticum ruminicola]
MKRRVAIILSALMVLGSMGPKAMGSIEKVQAGDVIVKYMGESHLKIKVFIYKVCIHLKMQRKENFI